MQKAIELGGRDRKDLKRLAMLKEYGGQWQELTMTSEPLESLGTYLEWDGQSHPSEKKTR
ncbi:hypothetical protein [Bacillus mycoides]|uniref:hypothetical protein n=1 Tax=Bacillus mycoides TaxID=1405 RepID=UPI0029314FF5|nr:hypothetical protein [Bacillus mycoides]WOA60633.1 hypothetical protein RVY74_30335 [Bacillus mycoides]